MGKLGGDRCLGLGGGGSRDQGLRREERGRGAGLRREGKSAVQVARGGASLGLMKNEDGRGDAGGWRPPGLKRVDAGEEETRAGRGRVSLGREVSQWRKVSGEGRGGRLGGGSRA